MNNSKTRVITSIGIGIAAMLVGGFTIYQFSSLVPLPGMKYILMAPYLSMVMYILVYKVKTKYPLLMIGGTFGGIMTLINLFMGVSIVLTSVLSQLAMLPFKSIKGKARAGAIAFAGMSGVVSLLISKIFIGGVHSSLSLNWLAMAFVIAGLFGVLGCYLAERILKYMKI